MFGILKFQAQRRFELCKTWLCNYYPQGCIALLMSVALNTPHTVELLKSLLLKGLKVSEYEKELDADS